MVSQISSTMLRMAADRPRGSGARSTASQIPSMSSPLNGVRPRTLRSCTFTLQTVRAQRANVDLRHAWMLRSEPAETLQQPGLPDRCAPRQPRLTHGVGGLPRQRSLVPAELPSGVDDLVVV